MEEGFCEGPRSDARPVNLSDRGKALCLFLFLHCGDTDSESLLSKDEPLSDFPDLERLLLLPPCLSGGGGGAEP